MNNKVASVQIIAFSDLALFQKIDSDKVTKARKQSLGVSRLHSQMQNKLGHYYADIPRTDMRSYLNERYQKAQTAETGGFFNMEATWRELKKIVFVEDPANALSSNEQKIIAHLSNSLATDFRPEALKDSPLSPLEQGLRNEAHGLNAALKALLNNNEALNNNSVQAGLRDLQLASILGEALERPVSNNGKEAALAQGFDLLSLESKVAQLNGLVQELGQEHSDASVEQRLRKLLELNLDMFALDRPAVAILSAQGLIDHLWKDVCIFTSEAMHRIKTGFMGTFVMTTVLCPMLEVRSVLLISIASAVLSLFNTGINPLFKPIGHLINAFKDIINKPDAYIDRAFRLFVTVGTLLVSSLAIGVVLTPLMPFAGIFHSVIMLANTYGAVAAAAGAHSMAQTLSDKVATYFYGVSNPDYYKPSRFMQTYLGDGQAQSLSNFFIGEARHLTRTQNNARLDLATQKKAEKELNHLKTVWKNLKDQIPVTAGEWRQIVEPVYQAKKSLLKDHLAAPTDKAVDRATEVLKKMSHLQKLGQEFSQPEGVDTVLAEFSELRRELLFSYSSRPVQTTLKELNSINEIGLLIQATQAHLAFRT